MCTSPKLVNIPHLGKRFVPCSSCLECRYSHARMWTFRLACEASSWDSSSFITLTYNEDFNPMKLNKKHFQDFFKRLRNIVNFYFNGSRSTRYPLRYFACGEYGDTTYRPHFHFILFGLPNTPLTELLISFAWSTLKFNVNTFRDEISKGLEYMKHNRKHNIFSESMYGLIDVSSCEVGSIRYVAGYVSKKLKSDPLIFKALDFPSPFQLSSKALGISYLNDYNNINQIILNGCVNFQGHEIAVPRYYLKVLERDYGLTTKAHIDRYKEKLSKDMKNIFTDEELLKHTYDEPYIKTAFSSTENKIKDYLVHDVGDFDLTAHIKYQEAMQPYYRDRKMLLEDRRSHIVRDKHKQYILENKSLTKLKEYINIRKMVIISNKISYVNSFDITFSQDSYLEKLDHLINLLEALYANLSSL